MSKFEAFCFYLSLLLHHKSLSLLSSHQQNNQSPNMPFFKGRFHTFPLKFRPDQLIQIFLVVSSKSCLILYLEKPFIFSFACYNQELSFDKQTPFSIRTNELCFPSSLHFQPQPSASFYQIHSIQINKYQIRCRQTSSPITQQIASFVKKYSMQQSEMNCKLMKTTTLMLNNSNLMPLMIEQLLSHSFFVPKSEIPNDLSLFQILSLIIWKFFSSLIDIILICSFILEVMNSLQWFLVLLLSFELRHYAYHEDGEEQVEYFLILALQSKIFLNIFNVYLIQHQFQLVPNFRIKLLLKYKFNLISTYHVNKQHIILFKVQIKQTQKLVSPEQRQHGNKEEQFQKASYSIKNFRLFNELHIVYPLFLAQISYNIFSHHKPNNMSQIMAEKRGGQGQSKIKTMIMKKSNRVCAICIQKFEPDQIIKKIQCGHIFHRICLKNWLNKSPKCPLCRYDLHQ